MIWLCGGENAAVLTVTVRSRITFAAATEVPTAAWVVALSTTGPPGELLHAAIAMTASAAYSARVWRRSSPIDEQMIMVLTSMARIADKRYPADIRWIRRYAAEGCRRYPLADATGSHSLLES